MLICHKKRNLKKSHLQKIPDKTNLDSYCPDFAETTGYRQRGHFVFASIKKHGNDHKTRRILFEYVMFL